MENINIENLFNNLKDNKSTSLKDHINIIKSHWLIVLLISILVGGGTFIYSIIATDIYVATTEIKITTPPGSILTSPIIPVSSFKMENNLIANEIQTILNPSIRIQVAKTLIDTFYQLKKNQDFNLMLEFGAFEKKSSKLKSEKEILSVLSKVVNANQKGTLDFIEISAESPSTEEAALIANLYAQAYREFNLAMNRNQITTIRETLEKQKAEKREELIKAENNIKNFQLRGGVIQLDAQAKTLIENLSDFESRMNTTKIEISITKQVLDNYEKELEQRDPSLIRYLENKSSEPYLQQLQTQIAQLEANRDMALLDKSSAKNNPEIIKEYEIKIADLKDKLNKSIDNYQKSILASSPEEIKLLIKRVFEEKVKYQSLIESYNQLNNVLGSYEEKFNILPARTLDLARLERERAVFEKLYLTLEEKYQEALINEQSIPGNVIIMNTALPPDSPAKPNRTFIIALGLIAGLGLGLGFVYIKHFLDKTIKTPEDLERNKIKFLTWIPKIKGGKAFNSAEEFFILSDADSIIGESFRALRTRIQFSKPGQNIKSILITSSAPSEGKSLISINLAGSFARDEKKAIIVDCDLRKPRIHSIMNESLIPGLSDYLFGKVVIENIIKMTKLSKLDFISAGTVRSGSSEILNSKKMISLIQKLRELYDIIIIDSPPILAVADTEVISNFVDASILVVSSNSTEIDWAKQSADLLRHGQNTFLGVVLNNYDFKFGYPSNYKYHGYYYNNDDSKKSKKKFGRKLKKLH
jgi:tyrosine-protein kinase Etk/Wzc